ncbi:sigma-70 family RNA polymerase sigma factor [Aeoliella mucimassa]|uniref:ECF RNA polymerase sigma-E factor n=1 Tax=Aeoliella mucimassa TaxID=2527972 RepID=A0A518AJF5_9BACT|nr:sigma-70 family RNA polymerase sigma factor [Aeoliella mucimassa]QDU54826.1 ECF RNA polymerase sigma-E factor [Aeoliella mucimassa]
MKSPSTDPPVDEWSALLAQAREGDSNALGEICERLRDYLLLMAAGDLGADLTPKLGASDIVQETMLEACRDFDAFRGTSEAEYRKWIRRLLDRNLIDAARGYRDAQRRQTSREVPLDQQGLRTGIVASDKSASSLFRRGESDEELLRAIGRLPPNQRQVIELRHRQGFSYAEIAAELGTTVVAARKAWSRAVAALAKELTNVDEF